MLAFLLGLVVVFMFGFVLAIDVNAGYWWSPWSTPPGRYLSENMTSIHKRSASKLSESLTMEMEDCPIRELEERQE